MTIGIDARFFGPQAKGLGRYTQKLIEGLEKSDTQNNYVIFLRRENFEHFQPANSRFKKVLADYPWYSLAEQIYLPWIISRQRVDLMHFHHFNVPIFYQGRFVVTIHDLILRHFATRRASTRGYLKYWLKNLAYRLVIWSAIKRAHQIITVSNYVKNDILKHFRIWPAKIIVTYEGVANEDIKCQAPADEYLKKRNIAKPYLLYTGNAYPHKNLERLIKALEILIRDYHYQGQLVLVGEEDYFYKRLKKNIPAGQPVIFTDFLPENDLVQLYCSASAYIFPSLCEGFGLPPLEAMARGVPVISSNATCLPEILGEAAIYFDPLNPADMAAKINSVLTNGGLRQTLARRGLEQIKKYSWKQMAQKTCEVYTTYNRFIRSR